MRAGALRHRLALQSSVETADTAGEPIPAWTTFETVYAEITPTGGSEGLNSQRVKADATHLIRIRYRSDVTPKTRGVGVSAPYRGVVFDFANVLPTGGKTAELLINALQRDV